MRARLRDAALIALWLLGIAGGFYALRGLPVGTPQPRPYPQTVYPR